MRDKGWKYNNSKIYCIKSMHYEKVYINGTTSLNLMSVLCKCINRYKKYKLGEARYEDVFKLIDLGLPHIYLLEEYPCENKSQLNLRVAEHIECNKYRLYIPSEHNNIIDKLKIDHQIDDTLEGFFRALVINNKYVIVNKKKTVSSKKRTPIRQIVHIKGDFMLTFD